MKKIVIYLSLIVIAIGSIAIVPRTANAKSCDYEFYSANDISFYDPCTACGGAGGGALTGDTNEMKVFTWLLSKGFNAAQASGMMGNMNTESSFNPFRLQTTISSIEAVLPIEAHTEYMKAFGLVQWDGGRRQQVLTQVQSKFPDFVQTINTYGTTADGYKNAGPANDAYLSLELDFMYQELQGGYTGVFNEIKSQPDTEEGVRAAAEAWNRRYEVSGDYSNDRANKGVEYYNQFKGSSTASAPSSAGTTSGSSFSNPVTGCGETAQPAGSVVWYGQCDDQWASYSYAGDTLCSSGCGPTSMAIILASLVDKTITPKDTADVGNATGMQHGGTSDHASFIAAVSQKWGVSITGNLSMTEAIDFVKSGKGYVWMGGQGAPPFTRGGHLVAMVGVSSDGKSVTIADPVGDGNDGSGQPHHKISDYPVSLIEANSGSMYGVAKK